MRRNRSSTPGIAMGIIAIVAGIIILSVSQAVRWIVGILLIIVGLYALLTSR